MPSGLKLELADGQRWLICPADDRAATVVTELGRAMRLGPGDKGRELYVAVSDECGPPVWAGSRSGGAVVCCIPEPTDSERRAIGMDRVAAVVVRESLARGGLLLHAALAERRGSAFVMAGPSGVGKSTASARLPAPWRSLCDDSTLVVRDGAGHWWAHPWPTWGLFYQGGQGGSWPAENPVRLQALFFLSQFPSDRLESVSRTQATALILESAVNLSWEAYRLTDEKAANALCGDGLRAARGLAATVPAHMLKVSLDGRFWEQIERALPAGALPGTEARPGQLPAPSPLTFAPDSHRLVYTGSSMHPTLVEPALLLVAPYRRRRTRPGDIVCFRSPGADLKVVHRVVAVGKAGVRTRGDNNQWADPQVLRAEDIIGQVTVVQHGTRRRRLHGGWRGLAALRLARNSRGIRRYAGALPRTLFGLVVRLGPFDCLLPESLRPRVVRFEARYRVFLKLLMGQITVGQYDDRRRVWRTRRLARLFADRRNLPCP